MPESLVLTLIVATVLGFLSGLGTGGGSLLILWLTMVLGMPQAQARAINLLFFLPAALIACLFHRRRGTLKLGPVVPAIVCGCIAAAAGSAAALMLNTAAAGKLFGLLLLYTGARELLYRPGK